MKRISAMVLTAAIMFSFSACTKETAQTGAGDVPTLIWYIAGTPQTDLPLVLEKANEIIVPKIGARIDLQIIDTSAYVERLKLNMASGSKFDLCFIGGDSVYTEYVTRGGLLRLNDLIEKEAPELLDALPDYALEAVKIKDDVYAIPHFQTYAPTYGFLFRKDLVERYGFDYASVKKLSDLEPYLETIKKNEPDLFPSETLNWPWFWNDEYETFFSDIIYMKRDGSNKIVASCETSEHRAAVKSVADWYKKGYIRQDITTVQNTYPDYLKGKYAVNHLVDGPGAVEIQEDIVGMPMYGISIKEPYITRSYSTNAMTGISKTSVNPAEAMKFLKLMNTDKELYNLFCYGIEGKHYTTAGENRVEQIPDSGYNLNASWKFGKVFNSYLTKDMKDDVHEETIKRNADAEKSTILGLSFDIEPFRTELANCTAIQTEYKLYSYVNEADTDKRMDECIKKMKDAGIDKIVTEMQRQVDEYLNNK